MGNIVIVGNPDAMKSFPAFRLARNLGITKDQARDLKCGKPVTVADGEYIQQLLHVEAIAISDAPKKAKSGSVTGGDHDGAN